MAEQLFKIKPLQWKQTSRRVLNKGTRKERVTETWEAVTLFGTYKYYSSVGGGFYTKLPGSEGIETLGTNRGSFDTPTPHKSLEEAKQHCVNHYENKLREMLEEPEHEDIMEAL